MMKPADGVEMTHRQCWECLKRRLVCDYTLPHCKKCAKNGKECPGYDEQKPLQWVEPGRVTSRRRRKKEGLDKDAGISANSSKYRARQGFHTRYATHAPTALDNCRKMRDLSEYSAFLLQLLEHADDDTSYSDSNGSEIGQSNTEFAENGKKPPQFENSVHTLSEDYVQAFTTAQSGDDMDQYFDLGDREMMELMVSQRLQNEARKMLKREKDPLVGLERMLRYMKLEDLPRYDLKSEPTSEVVQSVQYFNQRVYPDLINDMAPNPHITVLPVTALHLLPPAIHHNLVSFSLSHFIHSLPAGTGKSVVAGSWPKIYHHRGAAIRELSYKISQDKTRASDGTITSVLMLLCIELQAQAPTNWRTHADGLMRLFELRGGMMNLYRTSRHLRPSIVLFVLVVIFANGTSPATNQFMLNASLDEHIADVTEMYGELFPHCLCPPLLYYETLRINYLRHEASQLLSEMTDTAELSLEAGELLTRIEAFSPRDWAQPGANFDDWLTIGTVFKSCTAVYCIMSLQSLTILPNTSRMNEVLVAHADCLLLHLKAAFASKRLRRFLAWPLVVAGVEAAYRGQGARAWIEDAQDELSRFTGTNCPLKVRAMLRMYWYKEEPGWEECFNRPYAFLF
ncbi:hypothetical protein K469DRAFT_81591 [Zopfia rhizophila CBS 207.26]|uniref:Zn(2)-C6 fungal-type domain-containing protein n=1 Tax=Zopfia rhizophila CBS 207.26 TaxID=1314779 RepID=A0A6A6EBA2_9PEZI|nr:hypothetical protein K469DRAFT_81591 [Zopfia rhizophila CBS 207.26]